MKKSTAFLFAALFTAALQAATVDRVIVRQQWPWHDGVKIEYSLSGMTGPVDIGVTVYRDGTLVENIPAPAFSGDIYGVKSAVGTIMLDPALAFGPAASKIRDLRFELTAVPAAEKMNEVLYRIYDLNSGDCDEVTRGELLNGEYGSIETEYAKIGDGFVSPLDDVLIWTGVTNGILYKTDKLVMRKMSAKDVVWRAGDAAGAETHYNTQAQKYVKLTQDFYIGVFEITQYQWKKIYGSSAGCAYKDAEDHDIRPVETVARYNVNGNMNPAGTKGVITGETVNWPTNSYIHDVGAGTFMDQLRKKTGVEFDLPTATQWQFACAAGSETVLYSGKEQTEANAGEIGWYKGNCTETHAVGEKPANGYGLYDMLGNVCEYMHNVQSIYTNAVCGTGTQEDPYVDPLGEDTARHDNSGTRNRLLAGGAYGRSAAEIESSESKTKVYAEMDYWYDLRQASFINYHGWTEMCSYDGFRVVCPATADGQWGPHPVK